MSILVEKIARGNNSINDGDMMEYQYPPASIDDVNITTSSSSISIEFTWPNDTVLGGDTLVQVSEIVCLIKKGDIPYNTEDGYDDINTITSKDINSITFSGLEAETKYYIRFYVYGTNDECNNGGDMIYEATTSKPVDPVFGNNSWEVINEIAESGTASDYWSVGDEITITLSDSEYFDFLYDTTITLQIWGFNHFDKSDGSGKAGIVLGCKDTIGFGHMRSNWSNDGGYGDSDMKLFYLDEVYINLPQQVKSIVKEVNIRTDIGYQGNYLDNTATISDKVFIPSLREVGLSASNDRITGVRRLSIFSNANSRKKSEEWWTRSSVFLNNNDYYIVTDRGSFSQSSAGDSNGILFCFNI